MSGGSATPEGTLSIAGHECKVVFNIQAGLPVVFLHGSSYSSDIWERLKVTDFLAEKKIPFLALNMPYGSKSYCKPKTRNMEVNISVAKESILQVFGHASPILVGSSVGGHIALEYAARYAVKGLLLTSPVNSLAQMLERAYPRFTFPTTIIYGSEDEIVPLKEMKLLAGKLQSSRLKIYESAGHSAYIKYPDKFKQDLLDLYLAAK